MDAIQKLSVVILLLKDKKNESTPFFLTKIKSWKSIRTLSKYVKSITENGTNFSFSLMYCKYWSNNKPLKINKHINLLNKISKLEEFFNYPDTPSLPNVRVLEISGRIHARSFRCCGSRSQSSQDLIWLTMADLKKIQLLNEEFVPHVLGHFGDNSFQKSRVSIHPRPGKKSVRYSNSGRDMSMLLVWPLSFHADTQNSDGSFLRSWCVPKKYS